MRVGPAASRGRRAPRRCARATLQCRGPGCTVVRHMPAVSGPLAATNRPTAFAHDSQFLGGSSDSLSERATRCEAAVHRLRQVPVVVVVRLQGPPTVVPPLKALNLMTDTLCATCRRGSGVRRECTTHLWSSTGRWRDVQTSTVPRCRPHEVLKRPLAIACSRPQRQLSLPPPFPSPAFLSFLAASESPSRARSTARILRILRKVSLLSLLVPRALFPLMQSATSPSRSTRIMNPSLFSASNATSLHRKHRPALLHCLKSRYTSVSGSAHLCRSRLCPYHRTISLVSHRTSN